MVISEIGKRFWQVSSFPVLVYIGLFLIIVLDPSLFISIPFLYRLRILNIPTLLFSI